MRETIVVLAVVLLAGATWAEESPDKDFRLFMEYYAGEFNNSDQVQSEKDLDEKLRHPWHHYTISRVDAPAFGEHVFFAQINDESSQGEVVRQRVNAFEFDTETGAILQRFFAIDPGNEGVEYPIGAADLADLGPDDLRGYPDGCQIVWRRQDDGFLGTIAKGDCAVVSRRSGKTLFIWAEMTLSSNETRHMEGGTDAEFNHIFGPPGGIPFKLSRVIADSPSGS